MCGGRQRTARLDRSAGQSGFRAGGRRGSRDVAVHVRYRRREGVLRLLLPLVPRGERGAHAGTHTCIGIPAIYSLSKSPLTRSNPSIGSRTFRRGPTSRYAAAATACCHRLRVCIRTLLLLTPAPRSSFQREVLTRSREGRPCHLITITEDDGRGPSLEPRIEGLFPGTESPPPAPPPPPSPPAPSRPAAGVRVDS